MQRSYKPIWFKLSFFIYVKKTYVFDFFVFRLHVLWSHVDRSWSFVFRSRCYIFWGRCLVFRSWSFVLNGLVFGNFVSGREGKKGYENDELKMFQNKLSWIKTFDLFHKLNFCMTYFHLGVAVGLAALELMLFFYPVKCFYSNFEEEVGV